MPGVQVPDEQVAPTPQAQAPEERRRPAWRRGLSIGFTVLAAALVLAALVAPDDLELLRPGAFARIPLEALVGCALLLLLPATPRKAVAAAAGALLGVLAVVRLLDMGFLSVLDRPFDLVLDWVLFDDALVVLRDSVGQAGAVGAVVGAVVLAVAVPVLLAFSVLRLSTVAAMHRTAAARVAGALAAAWVACAVAGVEVVPGEPVAARDTAALAYDHGKQVVTSFQDRQEFADEAAVDAFRDVPPEQLLAGLRGKDVVLAFVESYGRSAVEDPEFATRVGGLLDEGTRRLAAAGYGSRSGWLTSPTSGGGSWLAQSTLLSGLWINNQQRFRTVTSSDRLTLSGAFGRANWDTVGVMPGITRAWPEGRFYGFDRVYDLHTLGYRGLGFSWATMPDQYTMLAFERLENAKPGHPPLMSVIPLVSSHGPWTPLPKWLEWDQVGDGSIYINEAREGDTPEEVWKDPERVRTQYRLSIEYSLNTLVSYVERFGDDNLVMIFLGDHQPARIVTGADASRDVPISIVARDPAVLDRISSWGWQEGIKPGPQSPVWRMDSFRDRFLTAYAH
ncbi:sulfatase [Phytohabitans sp. ZYX-F-186]|uniref:Sulfatase n=1 Tax=Phytohabitans maris TaxID=3071409 RepID=A0ABU0ZA57_9ACTN|nr:sulfatase [Phytohabitans sp. ZYX-F-186]MDQ7903942.1 sulfatase [Phytohabitans sp. ZYX-F-186]